MAHCGYNEIEIDSRLKGKKLLEIMAHESLHILFPGAGEKEIEKKSILLTNTLWDQGFRKTDNDNKERLQDGSK